jgi:cell division protein FtsZ
MPGKKPTNQPLQLAWHGATGPADAHHPPHPCRTAVIGIGPTGTHVLAALTHPDLPHLTTIALHTDAESLTQSPAQHRLHLHDPATPRPGETPDPTRQALAPLLADHDLIILTTDLGRGPETHGASLAAAIARKTTALTVAVVTHPGPRAAAPLPAADTLAALQTACDTVVLIDSRKLTDLHPQLPPEDIVTITAHVLANVIRGLIDTVATSSDPADLTDVHTIVRHGGIAAVGLGESTAPNRLEDAVRQALTRPLLDARCTDAKGALIHVTGATPITVADADRAGEAVTALMNTTAPVVWSTHRDPDLSDTLRVTLIMTGVPPPPPIQLSRIAPHLFNLEPQAAPDQKLPVDLDLYQLETF